MQQRYVDITPWLGLTQRQVADGLGVPDSTFSKRWIQANGGTRPPRKWPHRMILQRDRQIVGALSSLPLDGAGPIVLTESQGGFLAASLSERNRLFEPPVVISLPSFVES